MPSPNAFGEIFVGTLAVPLRHWLATTIFLILVGLIFGFAAYWTGLFVSIMDYNPDMRNIWHSLVPLTFLPELFKPILIAPLLYVWCRHVAADLPHTELAPYALRGFGKFMLRFFILWIQFCILFTVLHMADRHLIPRGLDFTEARLDLFTLVIAAYVAARLAVYLMPGPFVAHRLLWHEAWIGTRQIRRPLLAIASIFAAIALGMVMLLEQLTVSEAYYGPIIQTAMRWNITPEIFFGLINSYIYLAVYWAAGVIWWASIGLTVYLHIDQQRDLRESDVFT